MTGRRPGNRLFPLPAAWKTRAAIGMHAAVVTLGAGLIFFPPAEGPMLILPLEHTSAAEAVTYAAGADARPLGPGPYAGSLAVWANRDALAASPSPFRKLVLAIPFRGCA
ncbi:MULTISPECIES: hypothetical protein [Pacificimonas]|nr:MULTISPECIES: hypothetical protein [Pacificimonas]MBZ6379197.1 hypothetical protein [Pacificimonas aurantium]